MVGCYGLLRKSRQAGVNNNKRQGEKKMFYLDEELDVEYRDNGHWRSYHIDGQGTTMLELLADVTISEEDQDGGEIACYGLEDCESLEVHDAAHAVILGHVKERENKARHLIEGRPRC